MNEHEPNSLETAIAHVFSNRNEGVECPCCGQFAKIYRRALNSQMACWLIWLVREAERAPEGPGWVDVKRSPVRGGDYAKLVHWGLIEQCPNDNDAKRTSGLWRPTDHGVAFALGRVQVPSHVYIYANKVEGFANKFIGIEDALGARFDYAELMRNGVRP